MEIGAFVKHADFEQQPTESLIGKGYEHVFMYDHDFVCIARHFKTDFLDCLNNARESFEDGDWINSNTAL